MLDLEKITEKYYSLSNHIQFGVYTAALAYSERLQYLAEHRLRHYDWLQGHLGDIASGAGIMSISLYLGSRIYPSLDKKDRLVIGSLPVISASIQELASSNCDFQDIACYFGGALLAWTIPHAKEIISDVKGYFRLLTSGNGSSLDHGPSSLFH